MNSCGQEPVLNKATLLNLLVRELSNAVNLSVMPECDELA